MRILSVNYESQHDLTVALNELTFDFTPNSRETVAPDQVRLLFGGRTYIDRLGYLYSNIDPLTDPENNPAHLITTTA